MVLKDPCSPIAVKRKNHRNYSKAGSSLMTFGTPMKNKNPSIKSQLGIIDCENSRYLQENNGSYESKLSFEKNEKKPQCQSNLTKSQKSEESPYFKYDTSGDIDMLRASPNF